MHFIIRFLVNAIALYCIVNYMQLLQFVPGFTNGYTGQIDHFGLWAVVILAVIFGVVNAIIGPILRLVSAPVTWITHGLFSIIVNWALFALAVKVDPAIKAGSWLTTLVAAVILMLVSTILQQIWKSPSEASA
jgi:putative membrane protein